MGNGKIAEERAAEPVPNVGAVRRIPVIYYQQIKPGDTLAVVLNEAEGELVHPNNGGYPIYTDAQGRKYIPRIWE